MDPVVLFFLLGLLARVVRSDLRLPEALYEVLSIYLLLAIGLKGGVELARQSLIAILPQALVAIGVGASIPLLLFPVLRKVGGMTRMDAASIVAHYGSVSVVTFAVGTAYLNARGIKPESHMALIVALMEAPGIAVGILLARLGGETRIAWGRLAHEVVFGKSVMLLLGGLVIGAVIGTEGFRAIAPLFADLFKGALALFLLEMGLVAGGRLGDLRRAGPFLFVFGILAPLVLGFLGALVGQAVGLSEGGRALLATLSASASYIAAPTAMRIAVPEANPTLSIGVALGVTFPFNIFIGIPVYLRFAQWVGGGP